MTAYEAVRTAVKLAIEDSETRALDSEADREAVIIRVMLELQPLTTALDVLQNTVAKMGEI